MTPEKALAFLAIAGADGNMELALAKMTKLAFNAETSVVTLESELANANEELTAYKDFYGTSVAQVKHLQECTECSEPSCCEHGWTCSEYPTET